MEAIATQKFVRMSPRKLRLVADMVREMSPAEAMEILPFLNKRGSTPIRKVIQTAVANASQKGASPDTLKFKEIQINEGSRMKRFRAVSRGRAHGYVKQMSHIRVIVTDEGAETKPKTKANKNNKTKK